MNLSPSAPNGTKLLLLLVFYLIAPWSYALIYFIRENLGIKMVVSEANSSLPDVRAGNWWHERRQGLGSALPAPCCACVCARIAPAPHNPPQGCRRGKQSPAAQASKAENGFAFPPHAGKKGFHLFSEGTGWCFGAELVVLAVRMRWGHGAAHKASPAAPQTCAMPHSPDMRHPKRCPLLHPLLPFL